MTVFEESAPIGILMVERQGAGGATRIRARRLRRFRSYEHARRRTPDQRACCPPTRSTLHLGTTLSKSSKNAKKMNLTRREIQVLQHIARGDIYEEISAALGTTLGTLQSLVKNLYRKLDVHFRSEAIFRSHEHLDTQMHKNRPWNLILYLGAEDA